MGLKMNSKQAVIDAAGGQVVLAEKTGYSQPTISRFLNHDKPDLIFCALAVIAVNGQVSLKDLVDPDELSTIFRAFSLSRKAKKTVNDEQRSLL